jgi:hypothetical protein
MADLAVIVTIVGFFVAAALLTRALDRVIADTSSDAAHDSDGDGDGDGASVTPQSGSQPRRSA